MDETPAPSHIGSQKRPVSHRLLCSVSVINPRYEKRRSLIVSTNLAFKDWNAVFPNATCIVTLIDRLTHHADVTLIEGDSYRRRESEAEAATRRKRPS